MNNPTFVHALVEGPTEQRFIEKLLAPYLHTKNICITASLLGKKDGGGIKFDKVEKDICFQLKNPVCYLTTMIDFYGTPKNNWPGMENAQLEKTADSKARVLNNATEEAVKKLVPCYKAQKRFIPYVSMHEFEALLFSDSEILACQLQVNVGKITSLLLKKSPEELNTCPQTAPSKRLATLKNNYKKTIDGITIATEIGIDTMRSACPLFNQWLEKIESLANIVQSEHNDITM